MCNYACQSKSLKVKEIRINIFEQIGSSAVSSEDGELLFGKITKGLEEKDVLLILDWTNIIFITPTFLNTAIGQLYSKYDSSFLRERLKVENLSKGDLEIFKKVTDQAKKYFKESSDFIREGVKSHSTRDRELVTTLL